jgi:DNA-binding NarL/FixJ family response regulator
VVICTGFSERLTAERVGAMGIRGLLMKPVIRSEMARLVRRVLDDAARPAGSGGGNATPRPDPPSI